MSQDELIALARNRAKDPVQEHLREHKDLWNKKISKLLSAIIELKRGINGHPVPTIGINERSKITEPIPDVLVSTSNQLKGYIDDAFNDLASIIAEQQQYAEYRIQAKEKRIQEQTTRLEHGEPANQNEISQVAMANDILIKEASGPLSRLWTYVKTPFQFSDKDRFARKNMLQAAAGIERKLVEIESLLVSKNRDSIPNLIYTYPQPLVNDYIGNIVEPLINLAKKKQEVEKVLPVETTQDVAQPGQPVQQEQFVPPGNIPIHEDLISPKKPIVDQPPLSLEDVEKMKADVFEHKIVLTKLEQFINALPSKLKKDINTQKHLVNLNMRLFNHSYKENDPADMVKHYEALRAELGKFYKLYEEFKNKKEASLDELITKEAASSELTRWLKRKRLSFWSSQEDRLRIDADQAVRIVRKDLNKLMDILEQKNAPIQRIASVLLTINQTLSDLFKGFARLAELHNSRELLIRYESRSEGKRQPVEIINESKINYLKKMSNEFFNSSTSIALKKMQEETEQAKTNEPQENE